MPYFVDLVSDEELRVDLFEVERIEELAQRDDGRRRGHARIMPLRQVVAKPLQYPPPGILGGGGVVARSGVVEKRMVGVGFDNDVVDHPGALERGLGRRLRIGDALVQGAVKRQYRSGLVAAEVVIVGKGTVERNRGRQVCSVGGQ